jgi:hypothetical protein
MGSLKEDDVRVTKSDGVLDIQIVDCPSPDACNAAIAEGIPKILGGHECNSLLGLALIVEGMTGKQRDYKLVSLSPPRCSGIIMEA